MRKNVEGVIQNENECEVIANETSDQKVVHEDEGGEEEDNQDDEGTQDGEVNNIPQEPYPLSLKCSESTYI